MNVLILSVPVGIVGILLVDLASLHGGIIIVPPTSCGNIPVSARQNVLITNNLSIKRHVRNTSGDPATEVFCGLRDHLQVMTGGLFGDPGILYHIGKSQTLFEKEKRRETYWICLKNKGAIPKALLKIKSCLT